MRANNDYQQVAPCRRPARLRKREQTALGIVFAAALSAALCGCGSEDRSKPADQPTSQEDKLLDHLSRNPSDVEAHLALANLYYDTDRPHRAIPAYQEVLKHRPNDPNVRTDLGTCYKRLGTLDQARIEYERVLENHPEHIQAIYNLAVVNYLAGENLRAAELWERVATLSRGSPMAEAAQKHAADARREMNGGARENEPTSSTEEPEQ